MILRHATPRRNLPSIEELGLRRSKSRGKLKVIWLHAPSLTGWALAHTVLRHGGTVQQVTVLEVNVPRRWLRRWGRGLWYCVRDIPPALLGRRIDFVEVARSPVKAG